MKPTFLLLITAASLMLTQNGCVTHSGRAKSFHQTPKVSIHGQDSNSVTTVDTNGTVIVTGKVERVEIVGAKSFDRNSMYASGVLADSKANAFAHGRTNFLGTKSTTSVGSLEGIQRPDAINAAGSAAGNVIGGAAKKAVVP